MRMGPLPVLFSILLLAPAAAQDPVKLPKDPIRNWKYVRKDVRFDESRQVEVEEISLILEGAEAVAVDIDKKIFDLKGVKARYFTEPEKDKASKEIDVYADRGHFDDAARLLKLTDHVRVVKKNDDAVPPQIDTVLLASSLLLRFNKVFLCPKDRKVAKAAGRCPEHDVPLRETTVTSVEADSDFEMTGPEGILSGEGLFTDDALNKDYHIAKNGFVELQGDASVLGAGNRGPAVPSEAKFSQIFSRGPLTVNGPEHARRIRGEGGMRIDRIDSSGTLTIEGQSMVIDTFQPVDEKTGRPGKAEFRDVDAKGRVSVDGVLFADGSAVQTRSDTLRRILDGTLDQTTLTAAGDIPVHVASGPNTIEARTVVINKLGKTNAGRSTFEDVVRSDLVAGAQRFSLSCRHLETLAESGDDGKTTLTHIVATEHVRLGGLMPPGPAAPGAKADPGEALADEFDWDTRTQRGWLKAKPLVRITQGPSTIVAPMVVLESPSIIVLKGPKQVHLVQERDGAREEYRASCEGDLVLDQATHRLVMRNRCVIRTQDLVLHSDRINAKLAESGAQGLESLLALGGVSALRTNDHTTLYGDRLFFRFADQNLKVYGAPYAVADTGRWTTTQEEIRVYDKKNPRTGQVVRYTEMIGGNEPVRMEIEEGSAALRAGEKK